MPTSYELLVESAARIAGVERLAEVEEDDVTCLTTLVEQNRDILDTCRQRLAERCEVSLRYESEFFEAHGTQLSHLRHLAQAFRAEALLARASNDFPGMGQAGASLFDLSNAVRRGGLIVDFLVSMPISGVGVECLRKARLMFDGSTRLGMLEAIRRFEDEREPFDELAVRDHKWEVAVGYADQPSDFTSKDIDFPQEPGVSKVELPIRIKRQLMDDFDHYTLAMPRLLAVDLALRHAREVNGRYPESLAQLAPRPFRDVPLDPFTAKPFIYHRQGDMSFLLYSTGPKGTDGGAKFGDWSMVAAHRADLCLDAADYREACCAIPHGRSSLLERMRFKFAWLWRSR